MSNGQTTSPVPLSPPPMQGQRHSNSMSQHDRREATSPPTQSVLSRRPPLPRKLQPGGEVSRQMRTTDSMELGQDTGPWQLLQIEDDEPSSFTSPWSPPPATSAPCWTPSSSSSPWSPPPSSTSSIADYAAPRCLRPLRLPDFTPARQDMGRQSTKFSSKPTNLCPRLLLTIRGGVRALWSHQHVPASRHAD